VSNGENAIKFHRR